MKFYDILPLLNAYGFRLYASLCNKRATCFSISSSGTGASHDQELESEPVQPCLECKYIYSYRYFFATSTEKYEFDKLTCDISGNSAAFSGNLPEYLTTSNAYDTMQPHAAA